MWFFRELEDIENIDNNNENKGKLKKEDRKNTPKLFSVIKQDIHR